MSGSIYEEYKAALRRGHLAVLRGELEAALEAYREAAGIVPERALPHTSIGTVELRLGRPGEALAAFEAALERSPDDEGALAGLADALAALGRRAAAAEALDRLAGLLEADGRLAEACEAVSRALDLAESRSRRAAMIALVERLRTSPLDAAAEAALARALRVLGGPGPTPIESATETGSEVGVGGEPLGSDAAVSARAEEAPTPETIAPAEETPTPGGTRPVEATPEGAVAPLEAVERPGGAEEPLELAEVAEEPLARLEGAAEPVERAEAVGSGAEGAGASVEAAATPEPESAEPRPTPVSADEAVRLSLAAEEALEAGDRPTAVERFLEAAAAHAAAGRTTAALDACARAVAAQPDALEAQEALVHLYLELGWRNLAVEKIGLLDRLSALGSDPLLRARVLRLVQEVGGTAEPTAEDRTSSFASPT